MIYTAAEMEAYRILGLVGYLFNYNTTFCKETPHSAGNKLIEIAERIKAERSVVAMEVNP